jgi:hypothetical protein
MNKIIVDKSSSGAGVLPYLPLQELKPAQSRPPASSSGSSSQSSSKGGR